MDTRFLVTDFRRLKVTLPFTAHLKQIGVGNVTERMTNKGAEQICFSLMDRQRRTVSSIAHDVFVNKEVFAEGMELNLFYVVGQEGLRKTPGSIWIYSSSYIFSMGSIFLPGESVEEIRLIT